MLQKAHDELHQFNQHKRAQLAAAVKHEKEGDIERLNAVLRKEREEDEKEARCRAAQADLTRSFAAQMIAQKQVLASYEAEQEEIRKQQLAKAWDKRLAEWGREQEAREKLMAQVMLLRPSIPLTSSPFPHLLRAGAGGAQDSGGGQARAGEDQQGARGAEP